MAGPVYGAKNRPFLSEDQIHKVVERVRIALEHGNLEEAKEIVSNVELPVSLRDLTYSEKLDLPIAQVFCGSQNADTRLCNMLCEAGIETVRDLLMKTETDLLEISNFADGNMRRVFKVLGELGFKRMAQ